MGCEESGWNPHPSPCLPPSPPYGHIPCCLPPAWLQDGDEGIAVEACEFWTAFCESEIDKDVLRPFLPRVLPVLLKNMVRLCVCVGWVHARVCVRRPAAACSLPASPGPHNNMQHSSLPFPALPPATWHQAYEEFDEEVGEAEELEERALSGATAPAERDDEIKPYIHK